MKYWSPLVLLSLFFLLAVTPFAVAAEQGLVAEYAFSEGSGAVLKDTSGNGNNGAIHGAEWVKTRKGYALKFNGENSFVDCGNGPSLDLRDAVTLEAWVSPEIAKGEPGIIGKYYDSYTLNQYHNTCWYYISGGGNNINTGFNLPAGSWYHLVGTFDGSTMRLYINGELRVSKPSISKSIGSGKNLYMGANLRDPNAADPAYAGTAFFAGMINGVKVYNRALSGDEIIIHFKGGATAIRDTSWFDRVKLSVYPEAAKQRVWVNADLDGFLPTPAAASLDISLAKRGASEPIEVRHFDSIPANKTIDVSFPADKLPKGMYEIRCTLTADGKVLSSEKSPFAYPSPGARVSSPSKSVVPALRKLGRPIAYKAEVAKDGGLKITAGGKTYVVDSRYSFPYGGENALSTSAHQGGELEWSVRSRKANVSMYVVQSSGKFYSVDRSVKFEPHRIYFKDKITNKGSNPLGLIIRNSMSKVGDEPAEAYLCGFKSRDSMKARLNPTVFMSQKGVGAGMVALDDVYIVQSRAETTRDSASLYTQEFALEKGASYTLEWAVYLNGSGDYYDFINAIRKDEGRNNVTVEGQLTGADLRPVNAKIPPREFTDLRGIKYACIGSPIYPEDIPGISIEGIEFMECPKLMQLFTGNIRRWYEVNPDVKITFHIAHNLYANNKPAELFPDSRIMNADGSQAIYPEDYSRFFSKQRFESNWRWWTYYPTMENSFGKAFLQSVDVMADEMGCRLAFMDGYQTGYGAQYTYDKWDGHSADIDPKTKTITSAKASIALMSQDALAAYSRKWISKGGVVIANGGVFTRTLAKEKIICDAEVNETPLCHLWMSPVTLGNPTNIRTEKDIYQDVRNKLMLGNLYFYYGEGDNVKRRSVPAEMYPITVEEVHSGYVKGRERLVTMVPGVYGWQESSDLHFAYLYDDRGGLRSNSFVTTVDSSGVRTKVELSEQGMAVLKRIPVNVQSASPVNVHVAQYGSDGIGLVMNGKGKTRVEIRKGEFAVTANTVFAVSGGTAGRVRSNAAGKLVIPVNLNGQSSLSIKPVR